MALRVLLADESSTIKKVMQLALQDFDVEVKAVAIGVDVLPVAKAFEPHIIFADVLLAKKSGYEVCAEIKADPQLNKTPCVLMWSGFMELDQAKAKASKADQKIEKPFDPETLRGIVKSLVPETKENAIANFLSFPNMPDFVENEAPPQSVAKETSSRPAPGPKPVGKTTATPILKLDSDEADDFQQVPLPKAKIPPKAPPRTEKPTGKIADADTWSHQDLTRFKLNLPTDDITPDYDDSVLTNANIVMSNGMDEINLDDIDREPAPSPAPKAKQPAKPVTPAPTARTETPRTAAPRAEAPKAAASPMTLQMENVAAAPLDVHQMEEILRAQVKEVLQDIAWKIVPDVAERIVREEIQKLLKESERLS